MRRNGNWEFERKSDFELPMGVVGEEEGGEWVGGPRKAIGFISKFLEAPRTRNRRNLVAVMSPPLPPPCRSKRK